MEKIKILNLYGEALGLNGDEKNITAFEQRLVEMGYEYEETSLGMGDEINTEGYDIVFITNGKPKNISEISRHFIKFRDNIKKQIDSGQVFVVTGSANLLLGKNFKMLDGKTYSGIGILDCESEEFDGLYVSDAVVTPDFAPEGKMFACLYRYMKVKYLTPNENRMFTVLKADGGQGSVGDGEGCHLKNLYATWLLGPILVRNPIMMREVLKKVLKENYRETDMSLEEKATQIVISELLKV